MARRHFALWGISIAMAVIETLSAVCLAFWGGAWTGAGHGTGVLIELPLSPYSGVESGIGFVISLGHWILVGLGLTAPIRRAPYVSAVLVLVHWSGVAYLLANDSGRGFFWLIEKHADRALLLWLGSYVTWQVTLAIGVVFSLYYARLAKRAASTLAPANGGIPKWQLWMLAAAAALLSAMVAVNAHWLFPIIKEEIFGAAGAASIALWCRLPKKLA